MRERARAHARERENSRVTWRVWGAARLGARASNKCLRGHQKSLSGGAKPRVADGGRKFVSKFLAPSKHVCVCLRANWSKDVAPSKSERGGRKTQKK
jgi:hypothetical protein